jgi:hypothetical protein
LLRAALVSLALILANAVAAQEMTAPRRSIGRARGRMQATSPY